MQAPVATRFIVTLPSGLACTSSMARAVTPLAGSAYLPAVMSNTITVNNRTYSEVFTVSNRQVLTTTPMGRQTVRTLDGQGRIVQLQLAGLNAVTRGFDGNGYLTNTTIGSGSQARSAAYRYDAAGFLDRIVTSLGQTNLLTRDGAGRIAAQQFADGSQASFAYDAHGNCISIAMPTGAVHSFAYNVVDQIATHTLPVAGGQTNQYVYTYNADRQLTQTVRPDGGTVNNTYDSGGRVTNIAWSGGQWTFGYDATGRLASVAAPGGGTITYGYDGILVTTSRYSGVVTGLVAYAYDSSLRLNTMRVNGSNISYRYDNDDNLTNAGVCALTYASSNRLLTGRTVGAVMETYAYDGFTGVTNWLTQFGGTNIYAATFSYDKAGRITGRVEVVQDVTNTYAYTYDAVGRLTEVKTNGVVAGAYQYEANGNRTNWTTSGATRWATYDAQDRLLTFAGGTNRFSANGDLTNKVVNGTNWYYTYDPLGNLTAVSNAATGTNIEYVIAAGGRRVGKKVNGALSRGFLYAGTINPVAELNAGNSVTSLFVYTTRENTPDYMVKNETAYRIVCDHLGSPRLVVDVTSGVVTQRLDYDEFGRVTQDTNPGFQPFGFAGGLYDPDTGLVRFGARDYDAELGRWTTRDPMLFRLGGLNLYAYCGNDPVNSLDSLGWVSQAEAYASAEAYGGQMAALMWLTPRADLWFYHTVFRRFKDCSDAAARRKQYLEWILSHFEQYGKWKVSIVKTKGDQHTLNIITYIPNGGDYQGSSLIDNYAAIPTLIPAYITDEPTQTGQGNTGERIFAPPFASTIFFEPMGSFVHTQQ
jgi:RHS repeat-associated protein